jgi:hypothetical protein
MVQFWGATLWDFYYVHRMPEVQGLITISTGSKLEKWMKVHGELEHSAHEIAWGENEEDQREILPYPSPMSLRHRK